MPAYQWEKKGASLYTTQNVLKYAELRHATARLLNRIEKEEGMVFYVGVEKARVPEEHDAKRSYQSVLTDAISRLDDYCIGCDSMFVLVLDEHRDKRAREELVAATSREMLDGSRLACMIEPPIQAESHLFQTLQCADWICGLVGRAGSHLVAPAEYAELSWVDKYFARRLARVAPISGIGRCEASPVASMKH